MTEESAQRRAHAIVHRYWSDFTSEVAGILAGGDPESVHRGRVALRRLRTAIKSFQSVLPEELMAADDDLKWLGAQLSAARDLDVQFGETVAAATPDDPPSPLLTALGEERDRAHRVAHGALTSRRFDAIVVRMSHALRVTVAAAPDSIDAFAQGMLRMRFRRFRSAARKLARNPSTTAYHTVRRRARRLRFATEFVADRYGAPADKLAAAAEGVQDLLGELQDHYAARQVVRRLRMSHPGITRDPQRGRVRQRDRQIRKAAGPAIKRVEKRWKRLKKSL